MFSKLADEFRMDASGLESEPKFTVSASLLAVVLKGCFFNCASFSEMYPFKEEYCETTDLLPESTFTAMKRGMSCSGTPEDYQRISKSYYDLKGGEDRTKCLEPWEALLTKLTIPFVPSSAAFMIYDDHFETQSDAGSMATQKRTQRRGAVVCWEMRCVSRPFSSLHRSYSSAERSMGSWSQ